MQSNPNKKQKPKSNKPTSPTASLSSNVLVGKRSKLSSSDSPTQQKVYDFFRRKSEAEALIKVKVDLAEIMPEPSGPHVSLQKSLSGRISVAAMQGSASGSNGRVSSGTWHSSNLSSSLSRGGSPALDIEPAQTLKAAEPVRSKFRRMSHVVVEK